MAEAKPGLYTTLYYLGTDLESGGTSSTVPVPGLYTTLYYLGTDLESGGQVVLSLSLAFIQLYTIWGQI